MLYNILCSLIILIQRVGLRNRVKWHYG